MSRPIRVVVVDDSALARALLSDIINRAPDMQCVATAPDPLVARELIRKLDPDVITLDVEMPHMDGLDFLARLMRLRPMPVVMVSSLTAHGADITLKALELGAVDFVAKPLPGSAGGLQQMADDVTDKIRQAATARVVRRAADAPRGVTAGATHQSAAPPVVPRLEQFIFIGASTGGTEATRDVLAGLPSDAPAVLIAQHMPAGFTRSYAQRLDQQTRLSVKEAEDGERLLPGHAYVAPGGRHLSLARVGSHHVARLGDDAPVNRHRPSVEVLFDSAARVAGARALGVMLTGMGADGAQALRSMREAGAWTICQDEASCVVFGMPRAAIAAGAAHEVLPLTRIAPALLARLSLAATTPARQA